MRLIRYVARKGLRRGVTILMTMVGIGISLTVTASPLDYRTPKLATGPHKIMLTSTGKAKPHGLLVSEGDTVTWCSSDASKPNFRVEFKHGSPFAGGETVFTQANCGTYSSAVIAASAIDDADVFKYNLTIYGRTIDPHVIIVGGGPLE